MPFGNNTCMPTPPRCLFAFRLRTLLVLVLVLSIPLAWVGYSLAWIRERHRVLERYRIDSPAIVFPGPPKTKIDRPAPSDLALFGEEGVESVYSPIRIERCRLGVCASWLRPKKPVAICE